MILMVSWPLDHYRTGLYLILFIYFITLNFSLIHLTRTKMERWSYQKWPSKLFKKKFQYFRGFVRDDIIRVIGEACLFKRDHPPKSRVVETLRKIKVLVSFFSLNFSGWLSKQAVRVTLLQIQSLP